MIQIKIIGTRRPTQGKDSIKKLDEEIMPLLIKPLAKIPTNIVALVANEIKVKMISASGTSH
ncbi:MAG: hypothetical protein COV36_01165 [Alphaproteobacteria bacterium CG11_big_fil_rev_8_21_14_0_20_44_7]|nr:MAG: hypothetical protein COV36_01165 [Alphaproteobacteria bacterium CG11_big_fil_rev_8_21_14_0_20_44_7]